MSIYVSTGAFKTRDIREIIDIADKSDIRNIELSPGLEYLPDITRIIKEASGNFHFLIHNYFPPPKDPFALNLASDDASICDRSMDMCFRNIDLVSELGIMHYSVHCGFCFDTDGKDLGSSSQIELQHSAYDKALRIFMNNIQKLCDYALEKNVILAVENNVVADFAKKHKNLYLGVTGTDLLDIIKMSGKTNLMVLLDLAHATVSCQSLGIGFDKMVNQLYEYIAEIHVSNNDSRTDQNKPFYEKCRQLECLSRFSNVPITLEIYDLTPEEIKEQILIVEDAIHA